MIWRRWLPERCSAEVANIAGGHKEGIKNLCPTMISASIMAANMWKNSLKNVESDNNKILYKTLLNFFYSEMVLTFWISLLIEVYCLWVSTYLYDYTLHTSHLRFSIYAIHPPLSSQHSSKSTLYTHPTHSSQHTSNSTLSTQSKNCALLLASLLANSTTEMSFTEGFIVSRRPVRTILNLSSSVVHLQELEACYDT